ncbi:MAG: hypothetical protein IT303_16645 [Dehalococcoidia bacterium]|nr:hypothetical protein [Dehalococcoidia bacterium]
MCVRVSWRPAILVAAVGVALAALSLAGGVQAPAPVNDLFPGTTVTSGEDIPVSTVGATVSDGEFTGANVSSTVWYSFVPAKPRIRVRVTVSDIPVALTLFEGGTLAELLPIASGNSAGTEPSDLVAAVEPGRTYRLQVGSSSFPPQQGTAVLRIDEGEPPPNDAFPGTAIAALPFEDTFENEWATVDEPSLFGATVWYAYTAQRPARLLADTYPSDFASQVAVYDAATLELPGGRAPAVRDPCGGADSLLVDIAAGETLWFQVGGRGFPGETGLAMFSLREVAPDATRNPRCALTGVMDMRLVVEQIPDPTYERAVVTWIYDATFTGGFEVQRQYLPATGNIADPVVIATVPADPGGRYRFEDSGALRGVSTCYAVTPVREGTRGTMSRFCTGWLVPPRPPDTGSGRR